MGRYYDRHECSLACLKRNAVDTFHGLEKNFTFSLAARPLIDGGLSRTSEPPVNCCCYKDSPDRGW